MDSEAASRLHRLALRFEPLFQRFAERGHELVLVGGCVRDALLGRPDRGDFDAATTAEPDITRRILRDLGLRTIDIGARFGTIATRFDGADVEITTYRVAEHYTPGSRKPEVRFGTSLVDDLSRRDLSINAMAIDARGTLVDPWNGRDSLARRTLEVPGGGYENTRSILRDDPLRILRIARFGAQLGFQPTDDTTRAASDAADSLRSISRERWKIELDKLLLADRAGDGLRWLQRTGTLPILFPMVPAPTPARIDGVASRIDRAARVPLVRWTVWILALVDDHGRQVDHGTPAAAWPEVAVRHATVDALCDELRASNHERAALRAAVALPVGPADLRGGLSPVVLRRWVAAAGDGLPTHLDVIAALDPEAPIDATRYAIASLPPHRHPIPRLPPGFATHLATAAGLSPGPALGVALARVRDAIIDGQIDNPPTIADCLPLLDRDPPG